MFYLYVIIAVLCKVTQHCSFEVYLCYIVVIYYNYAVMIRDTSTWSSSAFTSISIIILQSPTTLPIYTILPVIMFPNLPLQYSVVKFHDRRPDDQKHRHLFFIFFEWKNDIIEQSYLIYTTTPWSIGAGLCGVFLTLHRGYQLAQTSYKRVQKDKERRSYRKRTLRELRKQKSMQMENPPADV